MKVGIDLVEHKDIISKQENFVNRVLNIKEIECYQKFKSEKRKLEYLASRFAVKEALIKCYEERIDLRKIAVLNKENGAPYIILNDDILELQLSITHTDNYSMAIVILP